MPNQRIDIFVHNADPTGQLNKIVSLLQEIQTQGGTMSAAMDALTAQVTKNTDVISSALTLIQGFAAQLAAAGTDPTALAALQASLQQSDDQLAAAVAANTPAAPPTP